MELFYTQPFIELTPLEQYPEIERRIRDFFPQVNEAVQNNLYIILTALLKRPAVAVSRRNEWYKERRGILPEWYTRRYATRAQDLLEKEGLLTRWGGYRNNGYGKGFSSVLTATPALDDMLKGLELRALEVDPEFQAILTMKHNGENISLTPRDIEKLSDNELRRYGPLERAALYRTYTITEALNKEYFSKMKLGFQERSGFATTQGITFEEARRRFRDRKRLDMEMASNVFFTAMFTRDGGGRMFQRTISFQNLEKAIRQYLTVNGQTTAETDYSGMHLNLAHYLYGAKNPHIHDPYAPVLTILGKSDSPELRDAVKRSIVVSFNTPDITTYTRAMNFNYGDTYVQQLREHDITTTDVREAFIVAHPKIEKIFRDSRLYANMLMFHESELMRHVLLELQEQGIPGLPLHDSVIYPGQHREIVPEIMKEQYKKMTRNEIEVKTLPRQSYLF